MKRGESEPKLKQVKSALVAKSSENKGLKKKVAEMEKLIKKLNHQYGSGKREWEQDKATMQQRLDHMMSNTSVQIQVPAP